MKKVLGIGIVIILAIIAFFALRNDPVVIIDDPENEPASYSVVVRNLSGSQPLSPGVFVVHDDSGVLDFEGRLSPVGFEPLAEIGVAGDLAGWLATQSGVRSVYLIDSPILPGQERTFIVENTGRYLSGTMMAVASNDGYALINSIDLEEGIFQARNYDNGTEENSALGSGAAGGQPVPGQPESIDMGTATNPQATVRVHDQLTEVILEIEITAVASPDEELN